MDSNMYSDLFVRVLNISLISCYTIVVVMVVRALILRWERKYAYFLWFAVFVNLCIPFRISGPFSLVPAWIADFEIAERNEDKTDYLPNETIITEAVEVSQHHYYTPVEGENGVPGIDANSGIEDVQTQFEGNTDYLPNEDIIVRETVYHNYTSAERENGVPGMDANSGAAGSRKMLLALVWGAGVLLLVAGNIRAVLKLRGKLKGAEPIMGDRISGEWADEGIKTADGIETPFLWGLFAPSIYLPRMIDEEECTYIIAHESYHRKRKDYIFKPLFFMIAVIHWFNPLVWAAYLLFVRDMEISCDEAVVASADEDIRKKYAESLLKYAARQNGYTLTPITFGEPSLKCRIENVLHYKEKNDIFSGLVLCAVIVVMAGLIFKPLQAQSAIVSDAQEIPQISEETSIRSAAVVDRVVGEEDMLADQAVSSQVINWKFGTIEGIDGENQFTKILMELNMVSGEAVDFRTFVFVKDTEENLQSDNLENGVLRDEMLKSEERSIAYVMAGEMEGESITGSLWLVAQNTGTVRAIVENITMIGTQIESLEFEDTVYGIFHYQTVSGTEGRIFPFTESALSTEITNLFGE